MSDAKFKTMRHIETLRNYLNAVIRELLYRQEMHDQSKLQSPEVEILEVYTSKLRGITYGSEEYRECMRKMRPMVEHHNAHNRHHPEYHENSIRGMNLIDLIEMLCDWKAAGLRHDDGNLMRSIEINRDRFGFSDELTQIFRNTAEWINGQRVYHKADES